MRNPVFGGQAGTVVRWNNRRVAERLIISWNRFVDERQNIVGCNEIFMVVRIVGCGGNARVTNLVVARIIKADRESTRWLICQTSHQSGYRTAIRAAAKETSQLRGIHSGQI